MGNWFESDPRQGPRISCESINERDVNRTSGPVNASLDTRWCLLVACCLRVILRLFKAQSTHSHTQGVCVHQKASAYVFVCRVNNLGARSQGQVQEINSSPEGPAPSPLSPYLQMIKLKVIRGSPRQAPEDRGAERGGFVRGRAATHSEAARAAQVHVQR